MTRSLYILRHAKAEERAAEGGDHERDLKRRGVKAARLMGRCLARLGEAPALVLSSTAVRARRTAELAREHGGWDAPIVLERELYDATPESWLARVRALDDDALRVLLVGHQPVLSQLIAALTGGEPDFPVAALARIDLPVAHWKDARKGTLAWLLTPEAVEALVKR